MKAIEIIKKSSLVIFLIASFVVGTMFYRGCERARVISKSNSDISIWHKERDEIYLMEQAGFDGVVTHLSPGLHRHDIDTLTVKLFSWTSSDSSFIGDKYLHRFNDSTLFLFIAYSEALWKPKQIDIGDRIIKEQFSFDFSIYNQQLQFKKRLSLLFCSYENPDTIIQKGNFIFGTYGSYFNEWDTLFSGTLSNGKRNGSWRYYQAHEKPYKIIDGTYLGNKRDGLFRKYYPQSNQLIYEENYKDNLPDGKFTWWFSNRQIESNKYFDNGSPTGVWEFYDDKGQLIKKVNYDQQKGNHH